MPIVIFLLTGVGLFFTAKYLLLHHEIKRLHQQINAVRAHAAYGRRLYLEENDAVMIKVITAINQMVDDYENKCRRIGDMERNMRHAVSCLSHDLRTPLTSLTGYLQLLSKEPSPDKQRTYLDTIFNATEMLRDLTDHFYELSRIDLDENTFSLQRVNLAHMVEERFLSFYEHFSGKHMVLNIQETETPPVVLADKIALKRVLNNIIQNLLRYAQGTVSITFSEDNEYCSVTIGNNISATTSTATTTATAPIEIDRIFERFYTTDPSRNNRSMGLGLYIAQKLMEGMGGKIGAYLENDQFYTTMALPKA